MAERSQLPPYAGLVSGLIGVAIGAGTGMWWMIGVLGGAFGGMPVLFKRNKD